MAAQVCTVPEPMVRDTQPSSCPSAHGGCDEQLPLPRTRSLRPVLHSVDVTGSSELMAMKCLEMASLVAVSICTTVRCGRRRPCIRVQLVSDSDGQFVTSGDRATDSLGRRQEGVAVSIKAWMAGGVSESR